MRKQQNPAAARAPDMVPITYMLAVLENVARCPQAAPWLAATAVHGRASVEDTKDGYQAVIAAIDAAYAQWPHLRPLGVPLALTDVATMGGPMSMLRRLLECAELNQDDLEDDTRALIEEAQGLLSDA